MISKQKTKGYIKSLVSKQNAASVGEYAVMLGMVTIIVVVVIQSLSDKVVLSISKASTTFSN